MPFNGSGSFSLIFNWQQDALNNINISSSRMMGQENDIAAGLSLCLTKDGQQTPTANIPMGSFRFTNMGNATAQGNAVSVQDVQNGSVVTLTSVAGTDTITANTAPSIGSYASGQRFQFIAAGANTTTTVTLNINGLGAKNVTKNGSAALAIGDIPNGAMVSVAYDGTQFQIASVSAPASGPQSSPFSFRNKLINALGTINQRGYVSGAATGGANQYTLDRWRVVTSGQNLAFAASGNANVMTAPAGGVEQVIEGANIEGGTYYLSWTGTATATVNGTSVANGAGIALTANTNATVRFIGGTFSRPQLELGGVTPFEQRPVPVEIGLCLRYFRKSFPFGTTPQNAPSTGTLGQVLSTVVTANGFYGARESYPEPMRATPTVTFFSPQTFGSGAWVNGGNSASSIPSGAQQCESSFAAFMNNGNSFTPATPDAYGIHYTASAEL